MVYPQQPDGICTCIPRCRSPKFSVLTGRRPAGGGRLREQVLRIVYEEARRPARDPFPAANLGPAGWGEAGGDEERRRMMREIESAILADHPEADSDAGPGPDPGAAAESGLAAGPGLAAAGGGGGGGSNSGGPGAGAGAEAERLARARAFAAAKSR
jgi:hypothetical protein